MGSSIIGLLRLGYGRTWLLGAFTTIFGNMPQIDYFENQCLWQLQFHLLRLSCFLNSQGHPERKYSQAAVEKQLVLTDSAMKFQS